MTDLTARLDEIKARHDAATCSGNPGYDQGELLAMDVPALLAALRAVLAVPPLRKNDDSVWAETPWSQGLVAGHAAALAEVRRVISEALAGDHG